MDYHIGAGKSYNQVMINVTIRPMQPEDIAPVADFMLATPLWQRYGVGRQNASAQLEQALIRHDLLLIADCDSEKATGFAWCIIGGAFGRSTYLRLIGIRPDLTGMGIGAVLLAAVEKIAVKAGDDLFLLVSDFNESAQRFYRRQGYEQVGAIPGYVLRDVTELIFRKRVSTP
jgi:ribosomal protein S18 acetylase RimI-like enzyme